VKQRIVIDKMDKTMAEVPSLEGDPGKMVVDRVLLAPLPGDESGVQRYTLQPSVQSFQDRPLFLFTCPYIAHCMGACSANGGV